MARFITTSSGGSFIQVSLASGEDLIVANDVQIYSDVDVVIYGPGGNDVFLGNDSAIVTFDDDSIPALWLGFTEGGPNGLTVSTGASVISDYEGVKIEGGSSDILNDGRVAATYDAIIMQGSQNTLANNGDIFSSFATAVRMAAASEVQNFGTIVSSLNGLFGAGYGVWFESGSGAILNAGEITGTTGVFFQGSAGVTQSSELVNSGEIIGALHGVATGAEGAVITNSGTISSVNASTATISHNASEVLEDHTLTNAGRIISAGFAYSGGLGEDRIINTGTILGKVAMGASDDVYMGRSGLVDGDVLGGAGDDTLVGGNEANTLFGGDDADNIFGLSGIDELDGGTGNDQIYGGADTDFGTGGAGDDLIKGGNGEDWFFGGKGHDTLYGGRDDDELIGDDGKDQIFGRADDDTLVGNQGGDTLSGGRGDDYLSGGTQGDLLRGGAGDDTLLGGEGSDKLHGGSGDDTLNGGSGPDIFFFRRAAGDDVITNFVDGIDRIDLQAFGFTAGQFAGAVAPALSNAGGGDTFLDLTTLGGTGSVLIEGLSFGAADASDFIL